jgi:O-antigen/teichoic acid export membrane protein
MFFACQKHVPLVKWPRIDPHRINQVLHYGGWVTITGLLTPILNGLDRFVIGATSGAQAITYYSIAFTFSTKLTMIPGSISRAIFPSFSRQGENEAIALARNATFGLAVVLTPIVLVTIILVHPFFNLWLGASVSQHCFRPAEILLFGVWVNGLAFVPYALLQGQNRPDLVAKFHALETVPFVALLWMGIHVAGVEGAAWAWSVRVVIDTALLFGAAKLGGKLIRQLIPIFVLVAATLMGVSVINEGLLTRLPVSAALAALILMWGWFVAPRPARSMLGHFTQAVAKIRRVSQGAAIAIIPQ